MLAAIHAQFSDSRLISNLRVRVILHASPTHGPCGRFNPKRSRRDPEDDHPQPNRRDHSTAHPTIQHRRPVPDKPLPSKPPHPESPPTYACSRARRCRRPRQTRPSSDAHTQPGPIASPCDPSVHRRAEHPSAGSASKLRDREHPQLLASRCIPAAQSIAPHALGWASAWQVADGEVSASSRPCVARGSAGGREVSGAPRSGAPYGPRRTRSVNLWQASDLDAGPPKVRSMPSVDALGSGGSVGLGLSDVRFRPLRVASVPAPQQASPATPGVCGGDHGHHRLNSA